MSMEHYRAAQKAGKKDLQTRTSQKLPVEMPALDTILEHVDISGEVPLGAGRYSYRTHCRYKDLWARFFFCAQLYADPWRKHRVCG